MMKINIATAPVSWGVLMKDTPNVPPYNVVLDQIKEAGYTGTELGPYGYLPFERSSAKRGAKQQRAVTYFGLYYFQHCKG